jgi:uncharacterized membrane protein YkvA (DUF1232 family)
MKPDDPSRPAPGSPPPGSSPPGHPLAGVAGTVGRLPAYLRLSNALLRDPRLSKTRKAALAAGALYLVSPIDLIPGFVPVAGQLDDLAVMLYAIRTALRGLPSDAGRQHVAKAGLPPDALATDIHTVRVAARWTATTVAVAGRRAAAWSLRAVGQTAMATGRAAAKARRQRSSRR